MRRTWILRFSIGLALAFVFRPVAADQPANPHEEPGVRIDENCSICHDTPGYEEGAHGDPLSGVFRRPEFPIGDCEHCHVFELSNRYYLFMPYNTNLEQRALCLFCHDGTTATAPVEPPPEHAPSSTVACVPCHEPHVPSAISPTGIGGASMFPLSASPHIVAWPMPYRSGSMHISFTTVGGQNGVGSGDAELALFDVAGRLIRSLAHGRYAAGEWSATWDGLDAGGRLVAPGTYFLRLTSREESHVTKVIVLR
jgi:hypothetical protein